MVEDLSGKGTMVSGRKADQTAVQDGADIALGQWRAEVRELASSDPALRLSKENPQRWSSRGPMGGTVRVFGAESRRSAPGSSGRDGTAEALLGQDPGMRQLADFVERVALSQSVMAIFWRARLGPRVGGPDPPHAKRPRQRALRPGELPSHSERALGGRALRCGDELIQRGNHFPAGRLPGGRGRDALPGRGGSAVAPAASDAASGARVATVPARRRPEPLPPGRARGGGNERGPSFRDAPRAVPR